MPKEKTVDKHVQAFWRKLGGWCFKVHGNEFTGAGIPDIVGCVPITITQEMVGKTVGFFVALEDKRDEDAEASLIQLQTIEEIKAAKGYSRVVHSKEEGKAALLEVGRLSKTSGRRSNQDAVLRLIHGARDRQNVGKLRNNRSAARKKPKG
jgi:hypothetical protein